MIITMIIIIITTMNMIIIIITTKEGERRRISTCSGYSTGPGWKEIMMIRTIMKIMIRTKQDNYEEKKRNLKSLVIALGQVGKRS